MGAILNGARIRTEKPSVIMFYLFLHRQGNRQLLEKVSFKSLLENIDQLIKGPFSQLANIIRDEIMD
jgi:hypothetical protein